MGLLLMLVTFLGAFVALIALGAAAISRRTRFIKFIVAGAIVWIAAYTGILLAVSLTSSEKTLAMGEAKAFCGFYFDCHLHVAVKEAAKTEKIGGTAADGEFLVVKLRFFNDARRAKLSFHNVRAVFIGPDGTEYERNKFAESELGDAGKRPFYIPIPPEGEFERVVVFDVPKGLGSGKLSVAEGVLVDRILERILIGDEDSIFHAETFLAVEAGQTAER
jgi:hypothetical protein